MDNKNLTAAWFIPLMMVENKPSAVAMHTAKCFGITPRRYNELGHKLGEMLDSTSGPQEFWSTINERTKELYLNDAESVVFGAFMCCILIQLSNSVLWGKKLAEVNNIDYKELRRNALNERGKCLGLKDGELEL